MDTREHFDTIAGAYRDLRYTDHEPVDYIVEKIGDQETLRAVEFGTGTGRYSRLLVQELPQLHLTCVDSSAQMLAQLSKNLDGIPNSSYAAQQATVETVKLPARHFDAIFTFNAVHHFDLEVFLRSCSNWLREAGHLFIYTRLGEQNAKSIWGRYFPDFTRKEDRLYTWQTLKAAIHKNGTLAVRDYREFVYERQSDLVTLLRKVDHSHYSTFRLYSASEIKRARWQFAKGIKKNFDDTRCLKWHDFNIMIYLQGAPR